ncbi:unnamed protein product [Linum tenue]|uniref:Uncharacterized protein n=1 Tax=Linum tenue TaxID=586396 RepID=A0AAV0QKH9_9ROSI|nr:unnamed protein product [Linum tenue]
MKGLNMYTSSVLRTIAISTPRPANSSRPPVPVPASREKIVGPKALRIGLGLPGLRRRRGRYRLGLPLTVKILEVGGGSTEHRPRVLDLQMQSSK